ncbi:hypothetical protein Tco_0064294 [Tanacetum coccineum]
MGMTTQSFRCKTHAHIHTTVSEVIKKVFIQGFRTISENQCLLQILKVTMIGRRDIIKAFKDSNRYEHGSYTNVTIPLRCPDFWGCYIIPGHAGVVQLSNSICVKPSSSTPNPIRIIPGLVGLVQRAKLLKENVFILDPDGSLMSTQEYMQKVVEDVGEDADFNSGAWVSATNYVNAFGGTVTGCLGDIDNFLKKGKLKQVVAIVKSCSPNALGDLNVTLKDLSSTVTGTIHYKVLDVGSYEKDITIGAAMILVNVSVFTSKPSKHYLNITKRNVVEVFRKDTVSLA